LRNRAAWCGGSEGHGCGDYTGGPGILREAEPPSLVV
jgi:hypothetical protein